MMKTRVEMGEEDNRGRVRKKRIENNLKKNGHLLA